MTTTSTALYGSIAGPKSISATVALSPDFMSTTDFEAVEETSTGVVTVLTAGVHYSLALDSTPPSPATLTFLYNLSSGNSVHWRRKTVLDQQTALTALGTFPTASVERAFDKAILALQEPARVSPSHLRSFTPAANWNVPTARYYEHLGEIRFEGVFQSIAGVVFAETMTTLPVGARPTKTAGYSVGAFISGSSQYSTIPILIDTAGVVSWRGASTGGSIAVVYMDGITFRY